jgi:hypothetical protein
VHKAEEHEKPAKKTAPDAVIQLAKQLALHTHSPRSDPDLCHAADLTLTQLQEIRNEYWELSTDPQRLEWLT